MHAPSLAVILFLHVGWTRRYQGDANDPVLGTFGAIRSGTVEPNEATNFKSYGGQCFDYAPRARIDLRRLGGTRDQDYVDGVLVVFTATDPDGSGRYVVGWFRNARVYAKLDERRPDPDRPYAIARAAARDCHVVPPDQRTFYIPSMQSKWPGVSSAYYAGEHLSPQHMTTLLSYLGGEPSSGFVAANLVRANQRGRRSDPAHNALVETKAAATVTAYYESHNYEVDSVEEDNCGWDLNVRSGAKLLRVEVKGCSGQGAVELTPNEYAKMHDRRLRISYRLAIVHCALSRNPKLVIFAYSPGLKSWQSESGLALRIRPKTGGIADF